MTTPQLVSLPTAGHRPWAFAGRSEATRTLRSRIAGAGSTLTHVMIPSLFRVLLKSRKVFPNAGTANSGIMIISSFGLEVEVDSRRQRSARWCTRSRDEIERCKQDHEHKQARKAYQLKIWMISGFHILRHGTVPCDPCSRT